MEDMPRFAVGDYVRAKEFIPHGSCDSGEWYDDKRHRVIKVEYHENSGTWTIKLAGRKRLWPARNFVLSPKKELKLIIHDDMGGPCKNCKKGYASEKDDKFIKRLGLKPPRKHERKTYTFCDDCGAVTVFMRVRVVTHALTETIIGTFPKARAW